LLGLITAYTLFGSKRRILMMQLVRHWWESNPLFTCKEIYCGFSCRIPSAIQFARDGSYHKKSSFNRWAKCWIVSSVRSFRAGLCHSRKRNPITNLNLSRLIWNSRIVS
jgi:hypothetical protein